MPERFPSPGNLVVRIPAVAGATRYRAMMQQVTVPVVADPVVAGAADPLSPLRYKPLAKLILESDRLWSSNSLSPMFVCEASPYRVDDTVRSCAIWMMAMFPGDSATIQPIEFQVRQAIDNISEVRFTGVYTPLAFSDTGLVVQVNGAIGNEWELWGRIAPAEGAAAYRIATQFCFHAEDSVNACIRGAFTKGSV